MKKQYCELNDQEKQKIITKYYIDQKKSFQDIATEYDTYANRIRRDAKKYNINIRDKSQAQKNALKTGKHKHPTKGSVRSEETKNKIGNSVLKSWDSLTPDQIKKRKAKNLAAWNKLTDEQKQKMQQAANNAIRETSKVGSKLEKFLLQKFIENKVNVQFHKEQFLVNTKLQIDLFLPSINTAIEVDGPSHFSPVWGEDAFAKAQQYDKKKQGLILGKGLALIRIKQTKDFSKARSEIIFQKLIQLVDQIKTQFPEPDNRFFEIEDV
jgi:very-short-patch-repair endonuclease